MISEHGHIHVHLEEKRASNAGVKFDISPSRHSMSRLRSPCGCGFLIRVSNTASMPDGTNEIIYFLIGSFHGCRLCTIPRPRCTHNAYTQIRCGLFETPATHGDCLDGGYDYSLDEVDPSASMAN